MVCSSSLGWQCLLEGGVTQWYVALHCDGSVYWREGLHSGM